MDQECNDKTLDTFDVVIIGAGISGINTAHHLQRNLPNLRYTILEGRSRIGGTWDLFRYPGIRSDTDLHSYGFAWRPWMENRAIADGQSIANYLKDTVKEEGIDRHIQFEHRAVAANWSSESQSWNLTVEILKENHITVQARFLVLGTGYYDYNEPLRPQIPGLYENFKGKIIHPQFWPEDLDYTGQRAVIIGSGATAITLLPNIAKRAKHVTMLQRSPTYILSINNATGTSFIHKLIPKSWSFKLTRFTFICMTALTYYLHRAFPSRARSSLQKQVAEQLPDHIAVDPHFIPLYNPWDQRLCFTPNGDFFECLRDGQGSVETGRIKTVTEDKIVLESGKQLEADIIITATGLKLGLGGNIRFFIDNEPIDLASRHAWRSALLQDIPNIAFMMGYINASWTLGAEASAHVVCRILKRMQRNGFTSVVPKIPSQSRMQTRPIWALNSTYVKEGQSELPHAGSLGPWKARTNYWWDLWLARHGSITEGLQYS